MSTIIDIIFDNNYLNIFYYNEYYLTGNIVLHFYIYLCQNSFTNYNLCIFK